MKKTILQFLIAATFFSNTASAQLFINELCASNYINYADSAGNHGDWIEIYNAGASSVDVGGMYLTDDLSVLTKFQISTLYPSITTIAAGGYKIFWFDNNSFEGITHFNAGLSSSGEQVGITASDGITIIDSISYPKQTHDVSFGRITDGASTWSFFPTPTPNATNTGGGFSGIADHAVFNYDAGFYSSPLQIELTYPDTTALIYYSLNGNEPSPTKGILYTSPIPVDTNETIRARVFANNLIPGEITTKSFFINRVHDLPVISITTDSLNLWDDSTGIYTWGPNDYSHTFPYKGANFWESWKVPAHIELFEANDVEVVDQDLNLSISGNYSRAYAQKSFNLESKDALGPDKIAYQIFPQLAIGEYKSFKVRNGGQDWSSTTMRDALNHTLIEGYMDLDHQSSRPAAIYLNGIYWGILNMEEKIDADYISEHHPYVSVDSVDLLQINAQPVTGDSLGYEQMITYITNDTMSVQQNYDSVKTQMDVANFMNYELLRIYLAATDWPSNNIKFWRPQNGSSKWRWILWDTEKSTDILSTNNTGIDHNTLNWATDHNIFTGTYPAWSTFLLRNLLANSEFKSDFIKHFADHINFTFCPVRMDSIISAFRNRLTFEMPNHIAKWQYSNDTITNWSTGYFHNMTQWNTEVDTIQLFFDNRAHYMREYIMQQFGITDTSQLSVNTIPPVGGVVYVDSFPLPDNACNLIYFNGYNTTLTAQPNTGYTFSGWTSAGGNTLPLTWTPNGDTTINAYFTSISNSVVEGKNFSIDIFPNPTDDKLNIQLTMPVASNLAIDLYDVIGETILSDAKTNCSVYNRQISLKDFSPGVYFLKITSGEKTEMKKIVVER